MSLNVRLLLMSLLAFSSATVSASPGLNFFVNSEQRSMVGLSCSSEVECQALCNGAEDCEKPVTTCLNCVGARSPYISEFFNNMGDSISACFEQGGITQDSEALFKSVPMVPLNPSSPYNALGLKDIGVVLKFMSLCPAGTPDPVAVAFTDPFTHAVLDIPLVKCGERLFPLVRVAEDCAKKAEQIHQFIRTATGAEDLRRSLYLSAIRLGDQLSLKYDILPFSEYSETQFLRCDAASEAVCQSLCHSSLSCSIPLDAIGTAKAIAAFNRKKWTACGMERFSPAVLVDYLQAKNTVSFSNQSLFQTYDLPPAAGGFFDFSIVNSILNEFSGVFVSVDDDTSGSSFFISTNHREKLKDQLQAFCNDGTVPIILGHGNQIERVFCNSEVNGYFQTLVSEDETCEGKIKSLSPQVLQRFL